MPSVFDPWPGPVWGLDFTGHGRSTVPTGGGYTAEILLADADAALAHIGEATVVGRGLGAWIALLLIGARPDRAVGVVLADGPGFIGGGVQPGSTLRGRRCRSRTATVARATEARPPTPSR